MIAEATQNALAIPEMVITQEMVIDLFLGNDLEPLVAKIRDVVDKYVPDTSTDQGRKEIASLARKVASSKVTLDNLGKTFVAHLKKKAGAVDEVRRAMREELDVIRDQARLSLTTWEQQEEERKQREELERLLDAAWDDAHAYDALWEREKAIKAKEAELARLEVERKAREEAECLEQVRKEREAQIAKDAAENAKRDAEAAIQKAQAQAEKAEREKVEDAARAKQASEKAERDRIAAASHAKAEQEAAVLRAQQQAKSEANRKEQARLAAEKAERDRLAKIADKREHQAKINRDAADSFIALGYAEDEAKKIVCYIVSGKVKNVVIKY